MKLLRELWTATVSVMNWLTFSQLDSTQYSTKANQFPISNTHSHDVAAVKSYDPPPYQFFPPSGREGDTDFTCDYSNMPEWRNCSTPENRECWLRHPDGREFNIHTDYEKNWPIGIDRYYSLNVTNMTLNADGIDFKFAKVFDRQFPGPWIQACWGDTIHVNITNYLPHNGTSVHWHGIRQWMSMHMDGVNGVTQCPIAPDDHFVYTFKAIQYGSSWYHSHYSVQYADGLQGPLTIHGPASGAFDIAKVPLIMSDWDHAPAFRTVHNRSLSVAPSIVINGKGNVTRYNGIAASKPIPKIYTLHFEKRDPTVTGRAKRYLLRLINTSYDTTFVFSIDNHWIQVIAADFVPIEPYYTTSVLIGIGQRYNVIIEANPVSYDEEDLPHDPTKLNFWVRTQIAACRGSPPNGDYMKTAILRYDRDSTEEPTTTMWKGISTDCSDEPYESLIPKIPWTVGSPVNGEIGEQFNIDFTKNEQDYPLAKFRLEDDIPLRIDYDRPIFTNLSGYVPGDERSWVVIPEDYTSADWVWMVISGHLKGGSVVAHPMHLHGHDFAILQVEHHNPYRGKQDLRPNRTNPPRRDVVLVPKKGFVLIAFKADNPGSWLMHCHIAYHASEGLALQVLERQADAVKIWPEGRSPALEEAERVCENWRVWQADPTNWDPETDPEWFQDDSGI